MKFSRLLPLALIAAIPAAHAQMAKKPLTQADWDRWRSITNPQLSNDGKWAAYTLTPQVGDGEFVVRSTTTATEIRVPVGYIGRPNNTPGGLRGQGGGGGRGGAGGGGGAGSGQFTADSRFAVVTVGAAKAVVDSVARAQAASRGAGRGGRGAAGGGNTPAAVNPATRIQTVLINLADNSQTRIDGRSPRFAEESGKWMLYTPAGDTTDAAGGGSGVTQAGGGRGGRGGGGGGGADPAAAG